MSDASVNGLQPSTFPTTPHPSLPIKGASILQTKASLVPQSNDALFTEMSIKFSKPSLAFHKERCLFLSP